MRGPVGFGKRLGFERLEARTVLNGTVMVTNAGGALTITGDASSNFFQVQQTGTTAGGGVNVRVTGFATKIDNLDTGTTGNMITYDTIDNNTFNGVFLSGVSGNTVASCTLNDNLGWGILDTSVQNSLRYNIFNKNEKGSVGN